MLEFRTNLILRTQSEQFRHPSLIQWNVPVKQAYYPKRGVRIQNKGKRSDSVSLRVMGLHEPGLL